jgi:hypothetical protein
VHNHKLRVREWPPDCPFKMPGRGMANLCSAQLQKQISVCGFTSSSNPMQGSGDYMHLCMKFRLVNTHRRWVYLNYEAALIPEDSF